MSKRSRTAFKQPAPPKHHFKEEGEEDINLNSDSEIDNEIEEQMSEIEEEKLIPISKPNPAKKRKFVKLVSTISSSQVLSSKM